MKNITKLVIPSSIREIPYCCFEHCSQLKEVELPEDIPEINEKSFWKCESLQIKIQTKTFFETIQSFFKQIGKTLEKNIQLKN